MTYIAAIFIQLSYVATFLGGAFEGSAETLKFHYWRFEKRFPKANDAYWDPNKSWENKYKVNYPGSQTYLVWTTDGYHMTRMVRNAAFMTAIVIRKKERKKWYWYLAEGAGHLVAYQIGFHTTYSVLFRK